MRSLILIATLIGRVTLALAAEKIDPRIAQDSTFPEAKTGRHLMGELILVEHVNRRGILRLDHDGSINKYFWDLPHHFQLLPYASINYHGAPATLPDLPLGTHLHGVFYLGPEGDFQVKPPETNYDASKIANPDLRSIVSQYERVLSFEDDFSYHQRRGEGWKIIAFGPDQSNVTVERVHLADSSAVKDTNDDVKPIQVLRLDRGTRIWKGREIATLEDLAIGQIVQLNLSWATLLGSTKEDGLCRDIWIDVGSRETASQQQSQIYISEQKRMGMPGIVRKTESMPGEGARGTVTIDLPAGIAPELIEAIKLNIAIDLWPAEPSLRTWGSLATGRVEKITNIDNPPAGHSGIQISVHFYEMLEGFRAGRTVRLGLHDWVPKGQAREDYPREISLYPNDTRIFHVTPQPVADRDAEPTPPTPDTKH